MGKSSPQPGSPVRRSPRLQKIAENAASRRRLSETRRTSLGPKKSCLKQAPADITITNLTTIFQNNDPLIAYDPMFDDPGTITRLDFDDAVREVESKSRRKSLRRVSFADTAHVRLFEQENANEPDLHDITITAPIDINLFMSSGDAHETAITAPVDTNTVEGESGVRDLTINPPVEISIVACEGKAREPTITAPVDMNIIECEGDSRDYTNITPVDMNIVECEGGPCDYTITTPVDMNIVECEGGSRDYTITTPTDMNIVECEGGSRELTITTPADMNIVECEGGSRDYTITAPADMSIVECEGGSREFTNTAPVDMNIVECEGGSREFTIITPVDMNIVECEGGSRDYTITAPAPFLISEEKLFPKMGCQLLDKSNTELQNAIENTMNDTEVLSLFNEIVSLPPHTQHIIKQRLRLIKRRCGFIAKKDWYEWRESGIKSVRDQLNEYFETLKKDKDMVTQFIQESKDLLPKLRLYSQQLSSTLCDTKSRYEQILNCDHEQLKNLEDAIEEQDVQIRKRQKDLDQVCDAITNQKQLNEKSRKEIAEKKEALADAYKLIKATRRYTKKVLDGFCTELGEVIEKSKWMPHKMSPQVLDIIYNKQLRLVVNYKQSQTCNFDLSLVSLDGNSMNKQFYDIALFSLKYLTKSYTSPVTKEQTPELVQLVTSYWEKVNLLYDEISTIRKKCPITIHSGEAISESKGNSVVLRVTAEFINAELRTDFFVDFIFRPDSIIEYPAMDGVSCVINVDYGLDDVSLISSIIMQRLSSGKRTGLIRDACADVITTLETLANSHRPKEQCI
ncbi:10419_t:CDS:10 [Paraglomus brasilianum]|uniref:10419_t:CDS:1 n=1 Tax=Paraglomus brasilianum TaxID=144538 RepID=A0A9N9BGB8_9GLOM|nr:10419_t:CDS:10 [Paraglomus brasilianum]